MPTTEESKPIDTAKSQFAEQPLPFPPVPESLAEKMQPFNEYIFSTRELEFGPYAAEVFVAEVRDGKPVDDYAVVGFDGHGSNSWAAHYFCVNGSLALFIQLEWGGAYTNEAEARASIETAFRFAGSLQGAMERATAQGKIAAGTRLVVSHSDFANSGWGWVEAGATESQWHEDGDVFAEVTDELTSLFQA